MHTIYDTIQELRAELAGCLMTRRERDGLQAELEKALAEQARLDREFNEVLGALLEPEAPA